MRHTEHKKEELIAHIRHTLQRHEEPYMPGAWERFNEKPATKNRPLLWIMRLSGAAAVLVIGFALFWYTSEEQVPSVQTAKSKLSIPPAGADEAPTGTSMGVTTLTPAATSAHHDSEQGKNNRLFTAYVPVSPAKNSPFHTDASLALNENGSADKAESTGSTNNTAHNSSGNTNAADALIAQNDNTKNITDYLAEESLKNESRPHKLAVNGKPKKWSMAFMLAPSFGNTDELNLGYGLSMNYRLSDRFSIHSGIAYNKMNARKNFQTNIGMSSVVMANTKSLEMITEEVTGIDIPLELRYHVNKNVYANMGVSGFAVLSQNRNNTFVQEVVIKSATSSSGSANLPGGIASGGDAQDSFGPKGQFANTYIMNQRTTEKVAPSALNRTDYLAFYNLSVGYTRKIYKNNTLSVEPFVKLPINGTADDLRMMGKGLRLKVGF